MRNYKFKFAASAVASGEESAAVVVIIGQIYHSGCVDEKAVFSCKS